MRKLKSIPLTWLSLGTMAAVVGCSNATFEGDSANPQSVRKAVGQETVTSGSAPGLTPGDDQAPRQTPARGEANRSSLDAGVGSLAQSDDPEDDPWRKIERWIPPILQPKGPLGSAPDHPQPGPPPQSESPPNGNPRMDGMPPDPVPMPPVPVPEPPVQPEIATPPPTPPVVEPPVQPEPPAPAPVPPTNPPEVVLRPCSEHYRVPATANPYFAGVGDGASLLYRITQYDPPTPVDVSPANSPVLVATVGDCINPGKAIYFSVAGRITFSRVDAPTDANGNVNQIVRHQRGAQFGKSDIAAPINSLIGVFVSEDDPTSQPAPTALDFSTQAARDYQSLSPALGQVFFIGTGKTSAGDLRKVVVPQGAARLYFAVMDIYQWNNNSGELSGAVMVE